MTAAELRDRLYGRHPGGAFPMPGPWTVIEEWRGIDVLAFSSWSSAGKYRRIGYEVKVSRADLRRELLKPGKRKRNVDWCHEFYFAVPRGLLTADELAWREPEWEPEDWSGERCPGFGGQPCRSWDRRRKSHYVRVPIPATGWAHPWDEILCPTCAGKGAVTKSRVELEAPMCWVPTDVGLVVVDGRGTEIAKKSPLRTEVPGLTDSELGQLVRWVSIRPDPRHHAKRGTQHERESEAA